MAILQQFRILADFFLLTSPFEELIFFWALKNLHATVNQGKGIRRFGQECMVIGPLFYICKYVDWCKNITGGPQIRFYWKIHNLHKPNHVLIDLPKYQLQLDRVKIADVYYWAISGACDIFLHQSLCKRMKFDSS